LDTNWAQVLFNSGVTGSLYLISAIALTLTYGLSRFPNFAHAEFMVFGAFMGYFVSEQLSWPFPLAFGVSFITGGLLGLLSYRGIFQPLRKRGSSLLHLMIASLALGYILRHTIGEIWGFAPLYYDISWPVFEVGSVRMSAIWVYLIISAVIIGISMHFLLVKTRLGKAMRATSSNPELAQSSGINTGRIVLITWFIAAGLAALAGIFRAAGTRLTPFLGWDILLPTFAVTLLGGIGSFYGAIVAAYTIGLAENIGVVFLTEAGWSTEYRMAIPFVIIILILVLKPQGLSKLFKGN
jgi:branched-subunit amino acid ABC-type transport system permease component